MSTPADALRRAMVRAGHNPNSLARATDGAVSATTIRAYLAEGKTTPSKLLAIAEALNPEDGLAVLRAYGLHDLADALEEHLAQHARSPGPGPEAPEAGAEDDDLIDAVERLCGVEVAPETAQLLAALARYLATIDARLDALG